MNLNNLKAALDGEPVDISNEINTLKEVLTKSFDLNQKFEMEKITTEERQVIFEKQTKSDSLIDVEKLKKIKKEDSLLDSLAKMITFAEEIDKIVIELNKLKENIESEFPEEMKLLDVKYFEAFELIKLKYCTI